MLKMMQLKKLRVLAFSAAFFMATAAHASGGGVALESAHLDRDNINSLQRGAANFMNYCSGCHSAQYVRFKTIGKDLDLPDEMLVENLMFNAEKTFEVIQVIHAGKRRGTRWFGKTPPDLSLMARVEGV